MLGGITGAVLLLILPAEAFRTIVPVLIAVGLAMVVWGPALQRRAARGRDATAGDGRLPTLTRPRLAAVVAGVYLLGIYGGYFGAAQGVLIVGLMSVLTAEGIQAITGLKNLLATAVNAIAAVTFLIVSPESVNWTVVGLIAAGATAGGVVGARVGRRLPRLADARADRRGRSRGDRPHAVLRHDPGAVGHRSSGTACTQRSI